MRNRRPEHYDALETEKDKCVGYYGCGIRVRGLAERNGSCASAGGINSFSTTGLLG